MIQRDLPASKVLCPLLGQRLRAMRHERGLSLRELARRLALSPSSVSQIETGKLQPSVRTLNAFVAEFGVTMDEVLCDQADVPAAVSAPAPAVAVQRAGERPAVTVNPGVTWERLMFWADEDVEFIEATYAPGGASGPGGALVRHGGQEFGHVISGTLHAVVGFDKFVLRAGDSITFPSSTPHRLGNEGSETARAIWVVRGRREAHFGHEASFTGRQLDDQPTAVQHR